MTVWAGPGRAWTEACFAETSQTQTSQVCQVELVLHARDPFFPDSALRDILSASGR